MKSTLITYLQMFAQSIDISDLPQVTADQDRVQVIFNFVLGLMGIVGVLIIALAGVRYMTSRGNPQDAAKAKNAILYTLVGLIVIALAFAIVNFVVSRVA